MEEDSNENAENNSHSFYLSEVLEVPHEKMDVKIFYVDSVGQQIFIEYLCVRYS